MVLVVYVELNSATCVARNGRTANVHNSIMTLVRDSTTMPVFLQIGRRLAMYHDIAVGLSSERNEQSSGTINFYGRPGEGETHVHAKSKFEKSAMRWRTDAIMAIGIESI